MALNIIYRGKDVYAPQVLAKPIALEDELERKDHFTVKNGVTCAGTHLIIDLWDASQLDDLSRMESALREAVDVCGATLLHIHLHHFTPSWMTSPGWRVLSGKPWTCVEPPCCISTCTTSLPVG